MFCRPQLEGCPLRHTRSCQFGADHVYMLGDFISQIGSACSRLLLPLIASLFSAAAFSNNTLLQHQPAFQILHFLRCQCIHRALHHLPPFGLRESPGKRALEERAHEVLVVHVAGTRVSRC